MPYHEILKSTWKNWMDLNVQLRADQMPEMVWKDPIPKMVWKHLYFLILQEHQFLNILGGGKSVIVITTFCPAEEIGSNFYFIFNLSFREKIHKIVELLDNPMKVGIPPPKVSRVLLALSQRKNHTKVLCNWILCEWQSQLKMKKPNPETGCPWYQPSVQNMRLHVFLSRMNTTTRHGCQLT